MSLQIHREAGTAHYNIGYLFNMVSILNIPPELRNRVYEFVVLDEGKHCLNERPPAITQASQVLRSETLPLWRGQTFFTSEMRGHYRHPKLGSDTLAPDIDSCFQHIRRFVFTKTVGYTPMAGLAPLEKAEKTGKCIVAVSNNAILAVTHMPPGCTSTRSNGYFRYGPKSIAKTEAYAKETVDDMIRMIEELLGRTFDVTEVVVW